MCLLKDPFFSLSAPPRPNPPFVTRCGSPQTSTTTTTTSAARERGRRKLGQSSVGRFPGRRRYFTTPGRFTDGRSNPPSSAVGGPLTPGAPFPLYPPGISRRFLGARRHRSGPLPPRWRHIAPGSIRWFSAVPGAAVLYEFLSWVAASAPLLRACSIGLGGSWFLRRSASGSSGARFQSGEMAALRSRS